MSTKESKEFISKMNVDDGMDDRKAEVLEDEDSFASYFDRAMKLDNPNATEEAQDEENDTPEEEDEPEVPEVKEEPKPSESSELKELLEQLRLERQEIAALKEDMKSKKEEVPPTPKKDKQAIKQEKNEKFMAAFDKMGEGDVEEAKKMFIEAFSNDKNFTEEDIEEISNKKAKAIAAQALEEYKAQNELEKITTDFYAKNKELDNEVIANLFNDEIRKVISTKEGGSLPVEGLYKKAFDNVKVTLKALGVNPVPQTPKDNLEAEKKAQKEKAKKVIVKQNATGRTPVASDEDEGFDLSNDTALTKNFLKQVRIK